MYSTKPPLPYGWSCRVSKSFPGHVYYFSSKTGGKTWKLEDPMPAQVSSSHPSHEETSPPYFPPASQHSASIQELGLDELSALLAVKKKKLKDLEISCSLRQTVPGLGSSSVPGLGQTVPGLGQTVPGLGRAVPGLGRAVPGLRGAVLGLGRAVPGLGGAVLGLGQVVPGLGPSSVPGLRPSPSLVSSPQTNSLPPNMHSPPPPSPGGEDGYLGGCSSELEVSLPLDSNNSYLAEAHMPHPPPPDGPRLEVTEDHRREGKVSKLWSRKTLFNMKAFVRHDEGGTYGCTLCDKSFKVRSNCNKHVQLTRMNVCWVCRACGQTRKSKQAMSVHLRRAHNGGCDIGFDIQYNSLV